MIGSSTGSVPSKVMLRLISVPSLLICVSICNAMQLLGAMLPVIPQTNTEQIRAYLIFCDAVGKLIAIGSDIPAKLASPSGSLDDASLSKPVDERCRIPLVKGTMYSQGLPLCKHLEHAGRCRSHLVFVLVQCRQLLWRRLGAGPGVHRFKCRCNEDSAKHQWCCETMIGRSADFA